jgi:hypothetical protein
MIDQFLSKVEKTEHLDWMMVADYATWDHEGPVVPSRFDFR